MATIRFPVLIWPDAAGGYTAALVGDSENAAAHAGTVKEALQQLKELLDWRSENEPWNVDPDLTQPELVEVKVEVLPQYTARKRIIPCPETVWLKVPAVTGWQENGLRVCAIPHLGLRFNYQEAAGLRGLAAHYIKEALQGLSPLELAGRLPPRDCRLEEIVLRDSGQRQRWVPPADRPELKILFTVADPLLHDLGRKRTASAAYNREAQIAALARKLGQEKANVLLVGESGVGKSTLLLDAAKRLSRDKSKASKSAEEEEGTNDLSSYRFWRGSGGRMIAGQCYLGEWEERCEEFVRQLNAIEGVLCVENLLELMQFGGQGPGNSVAAFLMPYLQRGELRMVAEATPGELEAGRRLLPGLLDVFQVLPVPAFNETEAEEVLNRVANASASAARLELAPGVVALVHRLFKRFCPYCAFPGPAADFLRRLISRLAGRESVPEQAVTTSEVVTQFIKQTGLPETFLRDDLLLPWDETCRSFEAQIIGQADATRAAARLVTTIKAGLTDPGRPFGVLLFCGPTGVGKTGLAKALADFCFGTGGQKDRLVRLDMSEYAGWGAGSRLLHALSGSPAPWIERVRRQPFCVLLFDEIEKASPEVFDVLLGLLDEGRLTDRYGRVTNFRSAIIILTSNLGTSSTGTVGFHLDRGPAYESEVGKFFRPEFFNRLDAVIAFKSLTPVEVKKITRKELAELAAREGFADSGIELKWSERLVNTIACHGYDHRLGARPLQRTLERLVVTPLARWKVAHPDLRNAVLTVDLDSEGCVQIQMANRAVTSAPGGL
jgi:ATP-dependent Clp protease ATP-binding subunit ClpC